MIYYKWLIKTIGESANRRRVVLVKIRVAAKIKGEGVQTKQVALVEQKVKNKRQKNTDEK
jgi:phosphatidylinositol kinase/protein kinase (PI-3  family)